MEDGLTGRDFPECFCYNYSNNEESYGDNIMTYRLISSFRNWIFILALVILSGCASQSVFIEEHGNQFVARHIDELKQDMSLPSSYAFKVKWKETTYPMADGYYGFVEPIGKDCAIHWRVNQRNKIVGYEPQGSGCDLSKSSDMELINLKNTGQQADWKR
jgi:hypothetical protein